MINQSSSFIKGHCWCKFQLYTIFRFEILKEYSLRKINPYWSWNFRKKQVNNGWIRSNSSDNWDVWEKNGFMYQLYVFVFACVVVLLLLLLRLLLVYECFGILLQHFDFLITNIGHWRIIHDLYFWYLPPLLKNLL